VFFPAEIGDELPQLCISLVFILPFQQAHNETHIDETSCHGTGMCMRQRRNFPDDAVTFFRRFILQEKGNCQD